jgi:DNA-binding LytR/AlgR family response regulator
MTGGSGFAGLRILIVEDNFNIATGMVRLFKARGVEVAGPAATVAEALATVATVDGIDGAVLDVNLRGKFVYPVVDVLRGKGVPMVFITGYDDEAISPGYRDIPCLRKPVAIERVIDAIRRELHERTAVPREP